MIDLNGVIDYRYPLDNQPIKNPLEGEEESNTSLFDLSEDFLIEDKNSDINKEEFNYVPYIIE